MDGRKLSVRDVAARAVGVAAGSAGTAVALAGPLLLLSMAVLALPLLAPGAEPLSAGLFLLLVACGFVLAQLAANARAVGAGMPNDVLKVMSSRAFWAYLGGTVACALVPAFAAGLTIAVIGPLTDAAGAFDGGGDGAVAALFLVIASGVAVAFWLMIRLSLVPPSMAAGQSFSLSRSWRLTRGHAPRIALLMAAFVFPVSFLQQGVEQAARALPAGATVSVVGALAVFALSLAQVLAVGSVAGVVFRDLGGLEADGGEREAGANDNAGKRPA